MPKIPQYQQDQLASSLVGTPGVDLSGSNMWQDAARAAQSVQSAGMQLAAEGIQQKNAEIAANARINAAIAREQQQRLDKVDEATARFGLETQLAELNAKLREDYKNNPEEVPKLMQQQGPALVNQYVSGLSNSRIQPNILAHGLDAVRGKIVDNHDWSLTTRTKQASDAAVATLNQFSINIGNAGSVDEVKKGFADFEQYYAGNYQAQFGPKFQEMYQKAKAQGIKNYLSNLSMGSNEDIAQMGQIIKSGVFEDDIDATELRGIYGPVQQQAREQQRYNDAIAAYEKNFNYATKLGDLQRKTLGGGGEARKAIEDFKDELRNDPKAPKWAITAVESIQTSLDRQDQKQGKKDAAIQNAAEYKAQRYNAGIEVAKLEKRIFTGSKKNPIRKDVTAEDLLNYKAAAIKAAGIGAITADKYGKIESTVDMLFEAKDPKNPKNAPLNIFGFQIGKRNELDKQWKTGSLKNAVLNETEQNYFKLVKLYRSANPGKEPSQAVLQNLWKRGYSDALKDVTVKSKKKPVQKPKPKQTTQLDQ